MKGQTGIGSLIVFIALVLTAAIAAFLITQTTTAAQSKAAAVADQARERTGTTVEVIRVEGLVNSNGTINDYILYTRLAPGSSPINLNTTYILYYTASGRETFTYGGHLPNETALPSVANGYYYVLDNDSAEPVISDVLESGELLALGVVANYPIGPSNWWEFSIVPENGQPADIYGIAPDVFVGNVTILR